MVPGRMELGLSLEETMANAGRDLVLSLGMVAEARRDEERGAGEEGAGVRGGEVQPASGAAHAPARTGARPQSPMAAAVRGYQERERG